MEEIIQEKEDMKEIENMIESKVIDLIENLTEIEDMKDRMIRDTKEIKNMNKKELEIEIEEKDMQTI